MLIVGFGHQSGVGKDEAARWIAGALLDLDMKPRIRGFATTLKDAARIIFNLSDEQLYGHLKEVVDLRYGVSPRIILQKFGNDLRDLFWETVWTDALKNKIPEYEKQGVTHLFITDVRYPNEAKVIKELGGYLVKIERENRTLPGNPNHSSETAMNSFNDWDYVVQNNGTIEEFRDKVMDVYRKIAVNQKG